MLDPRLRSLAAFLTDRRAPRRRAAGHVALASVLALALISCGGDDDDDASPSPTPSGSTTPTPTPSGTATPTPSPTPVLVTETTNFLVGTNEWRAGFADYQLGQENAYQLAQGFEPVPAPLADRNGYYLNGANPSSSLFMYLFKRVPGLFPNTRYRVQGTVTFATNAPAGCPGGPGENVYIKAGASQRAPATEATSTNTNFDKGGANTTSGSEVVRIGDFTQTTASGTCASPTYSVKTLTIPAGTGPIVTPTAAGELWLVMGTDSGFNGVTRIYFLESNFTLTPVS